VSATTPGGEREFLLFVYDALMAGEAEHARLDGARALGPAATEPRFDLVDLGAQAAALIPGGTTSVRGEVYALGAKLLASIDVHRGHPLRYRREGIRLEDGRAVEAYAIDPDQARGRRRIRGGDWRAHVAPAPTAQRDGAWSRWAKGRR
jgi:gamma-glutamylaminecyclotransferase